MSECIGVLFCFKTWVVMCSSGRLYIWTGSDHHKINEIIHVGSKNCFGFKAKVILETVVANCMLLPDNLCEQLLSTRTEPSSTAYKWRSNVPHVWVKCDLSETKTMAVVHFIFRQLKKYQYWKSSWFNSLPSASAQKHFNLDDVVQLPSLLLMDRNQLKVSISAMESVIPATI